MTQTANSPLRSSAGLLDRCSKFKAAHPVAPLPLASLTSNWRHPSLQTQWRQSAIHAYGRSINLPGSVFGTGDIFFINLTFVNENESKNLKKFWKGIIEKRLTRYRFFLIIFSC